MSSGHWELHIPSWRGTACKRDGIWGSPNTGLPLRSQEAHSECQLGDNAPIQRFPTPAPSCVQYVLYRVILMLTGHRNCAPTASAFPHPSPCLRGLTALSQEGQADPTFRCQKETCPHPWAPKPPPPSLWPQEKLEPPAPTPATPSEKGLWAQGVFGHFSFCLEAISFSLSIPEPGACCQTGAVVPAPTSPFSLLPLGFSLLQHLPFPSFLWASPCTMFTHPISVPMNGCWSHSCGVPCQVCKPTLLAPSFAQGLGLAALGWERDVGKWVKVRAG